MVLDFCFLVPFGRQNIDYWYFLSVLSIVFCVLCGFQAVDGVRMVKNTLNVRNSNNRITSSHTICQVEC